MRPLRAPWLATLRATIRLLYHSHPHAFLVSAVASLAEPLFFPAFILLLQRLLQNITSGGTVHITPTVIQLGIALLALLLVQRLGIIVRDASSTILRQEAWVAISKQVMQKLPAVPYPSSKTMPFKPATGWSSAKLLSAQSRWLTRCSRPRQSSSAFWVWPSPSSPLHH